MNMRRLSRGIIIAAIILSAVTVYAEMSSSLYRIDQDAISYGGGAGSSSNYISEGAVGGLIVGDASSTNYSSKSGYPLFADPYIYVTDALDVNLGSMSGMANDELSGTTSWEVYTNNPIGYVATLRSDTTQSLLRTDGLESFLDYVPATSDPDFMLVDPVNTNIFAFTVNGDDVVPAFRDDGSQCNFVGSDSSPDRCWSGLSITPMIVAINNAATPGAIKTAATFRIRVGSSSTAQPGEYHATVYFTVTPQF